MAEQIEDPVKELVEEVEIAGRKIKPWTIVDLARLAPSIERICIGLKERGVSLKNAEGSIDKVVFAVLPEAPAILAVTLKTTVEEIEQIPNGDVLQFVAGIIELNTAYLKNWFAPIAEMAARIVR